MNSLDELVYYCNEDSPVGALMFTGEWGCGKTYLLEHQLSEKLKDTHILVRVSLFGIDSIAALHLSVKKQWVKSCGSFLGKLQGQEKAARTGKTIFSTVASLIPYLKDIKDSILAINPLDYITIEPRVDLDGKIKKVVLIFDDLERCKIDTVDVLGCINEYCENLRFNTIIVANEKKIDGVKNNGEPQISYSEIKEKIIARTVGYSPDYDSILNSLLRNKVCGNDDYTAFLIENKLLIQSVFSNAPENPEGAQTQQPHNIRSLKCALQDFHRIYPLLKQAEIDHIDQFLYSFIAYTMAAKAGIAKEDEYGFLFANMSVQKIYPFYHERNMFRTAQQWIHRGEWDSELFQHELNMLVESQKSKEPQDRLRNARFIDFEEEEILAGYEGLLDDAYSGKLSLDEYLQLIENSYYIREYEIAVPKQIDWDKVVDGINSRLRGDIENKTIESHSLRYTSEEQKELLNADEKQAYELIESFRNDNRLMFARNRQMYLEELSKSGSGAFSICRNKRFDVFDEEMATATVECYKHSPQYEKRFFPGYFNDIWQCCDTSQDVKKVETRDGFRKLLALLDTLCHDYKEAGKNIAARHTADFSVSVGKLIEKLDATIAKET